MAPSIRSFRSSTKQLTHQSNRRGDASPTLTATTSASFLDLGDEGPAVVINRADLRASVVAYETLLAAAKAYRNAMMALSAASTGFAHALEECARVKGAGTSGEQLLAASGMQYLVASSGQILSDTLYRSFEIPLLHAYDTYVATVSARHSEYEALLAEKTAAIRQTEMENMKQGRKKNRDLAQFRKALERLQEQVMQVEVCKRSYYSEVLDHETETWYSISGKIALVLRSTVDLSDRLATKGTSDPVLEAMMNEHPDPFNVYKAHDEPPRDIFTVLPPLGMNLGLGGSKRSSISIDDDDQTRTEVHVPRPGSSRATLREDTTTPKAGSRKASSSTSVSVADALGIDDTPTKAFPRGGGSREDDLGRHSEGQQPKNSTPRRAAFRRIETHSRDSSDGASTKSSPLRPVPKSRDNTDDDDHDEEEDQDSSPRDGSPPIGTSTDVSSTNRHQRTSSQRSSSTTGGLNKTTTNKGLNRTPLTSPRKSKHASHQGRRQNELSCVTEADVPPDPMSGDWGAPVYGKSLSPVMNGTGGGYDSGEEETVWGGQRSGP
ncbi:BQ2448_4836 [Microbotryum intermedium]|uniref:BQ2448_4836 protein n=1 Tax=Microbotryum intermedium TaxID=269621 RepID=A0A238FE90_9BASI|nr:BQ2448_4836 [Microbotryum intermedium]